MISSGFICLFLRTFYFIKALHRKGKRVLDGYFVSLRYAVMTFKSHSSYGVHIVIKMSHDYELEQSSLKSMAEVLLKELKQQEQQKTNAKAFVTAVKKYTDMQELDAAVLREFIDRIEVSHADKKSKTREITIVYNFIGAFDFTRAIQEACDTTQKQKKTA